MQKVDECEAFYTYDMKTRVHMAVHIQGLLDNMKGKKITFFQHDDGRPMTDREARNYIGQCLAKGWKLIPSTYECEGFDPFVHGCPGHPMPESAD